MIARLIANTSLIRLWREHAPNVAWVLLEKAWVLVSGLIVGFWLVRHLGPDDYGVFSAALSVTVIFAGLSTMGLETVFLRRLADATVDQRKTLSSAIALRLLGSLIYIPLSGLAALIFFGANAEPLRLALLIAIGAIFRAPELVGLRLQAHGLYRQASLIRIFVRLIGDVVRVALILDGASSVHFAAALALESVITGALFLVAGKRGISLQAISGSETKLLFSQSWPILLSGLIAAAYARADQIMLFSLAGANATGSYAAAVRVSEVFMIVIASLTTVAASNFGRISHTTPELFQSRFVTYYRASLLAGFLTSLSLSIFSDEVASLLYGKKFPKETGEILGIYAWTVMFVWISAAMEPWFFHHNKQHLYIQKTLLSLLLALPLVFFATIWFGGRGTAFATVGTYFFSVFATNALLPAARPAWHFQLAALKLARGNR